VRNARSSSNLRLTSRLASPLGSGKKIAVVASPTSACPWQRIAAVWLQQASNCYIRTRCDPSRFPFFSCVID
jgi:hypothetical protein